MKSIFVTAALILITSTFVSADKQRTFNPTPGYVIAKKLPSNFKAEIDSLVFKIYDAFEGSKTHTEMDRDFFAVGNKLHIESSRRTIKKRLLFKKGSKITQEVLLETERRLRAEEFLADAIIEVSPISNGRVNIIVHTYDQWTTVPPLSINRVGGEWIYWFGLVESNLIGTGQKLGFYYRKDIDRKTIWSQYDNNAFITNNLRLSGTIANATDGYTYLGSLTRPLLSKQQRWGFSVSGSAVKSRKYYYADADRPAEVADLLADSQEADSLKVKKADYNLLFSYPDIVNMSGYASLSGSFGIKHKRILTGFVEWKEQYRDGKNVQEYYNSVFNGAKPKRLNLDLREDLLTGFRFSYFKNTYKTVKNFRNLKWNEDIDVGFRITNSIAKNLSPEGSKNSDFHFSHTVVYINAWISKYFLTSSISTSYYMGDIGEYEDGIVNQAFEFQWKPVPKTSTYFVSRWTNYFSKEKASQLLLGEETGLSAYPNRFFTGQARLLMELEQRYFPDFEIGTGVPAFAVFLNAGNVWENYERFEWDELHYSTGLGLRLGASRSTQKVVNHFNFAIPLDPKFRDILEWTFSITAEANL